MGIDGWFIAIVGEVAHCDRANAERKSGEGEEEV